MSTEQQQGPTEQAREYIEDVVKINSQFGMSSTSTDDDYSTEIAAAAAAFDWVSRVGQQSR